MRGVSGAADTDPVERPAPQMPSPDADGVRDEEIAEPKLELATAFDSPAAADEEEHDEEEEEAPRSEPAQTQDPLKLYVRQIGDGPLLAVA